MSKSNFWFVKDLGGILCCIFTWILILFALFTFLIVVRPLFFINSPEIKSKIFYTSLYLFLTLFAIFSHTKTMLSDPNESNQDTFLSSGRKYLVCSICSSLKPARAHHCSVCKRCIRKMDHHCPWVNNCVGEANIKYFLLFLFYIASMSIYSVFAASIGLLNLTKIETSGIPY
ncbi:palmitoyltransferase ZDHHC3-A-like [Octopus sinensis]|uniref:Palmitoyltransferase n=1 Tax=Octopus sinensis TaxID=2607531 RepID=A0A6P7U3F7_9MOLL|nr:palmitoyltransferase ZDHHC3-A-like [Octopus sinensis]